MSGPKEPIKVFARWDAVNGAYFEDANGAVWYQGVTGKPSRQRGTRAEVEERIIKGELRGALVTPRKNPAKRSYVSRPSQITKRAPTKRLRKRRAKNVAKPRKGFFPNPAPVKFMIVARKSKAGPKMHFDGKNFSQRKEVEKFDTAVIAESKARRLIAAHPVLRKYRVSIEHVPRPR